jgi:hypothetical protein
MMSKKEELTSFFIKIASEASPYSMLAIQAQLGKAIFRDLNLDKLVHNQGAEKTTIGTKQL